MRLLIMGAPGAGKGTQGKLLASHLGIPAISTGAIFRSHVQGETALGLEVKRLMDAGDFVPDSIVEQIVAERLDQDDAAGGFLLDGFPRTVHQAYALDGILDRSHLQLDHAISLTVENEALVARMLHRAEIEGRADDNEETIRHRMAVYHGETEPLLALYRERDKLIEVDGDGTIDEVQARVRAALAAAHDDGV
jgi:adenylate kinase